MVRGEFDEVSVHISLHCEAPFCWVEALQAELVSVRGATSAIQAGYRFDLCAK